MKDIPLFTSEYGAASLVLREIPYRQRAYITLQSSLEPALLLEECIGFCRACGAETVFAAGHSYLHRFPKECSILQMEADARLLAKADAELIPVTEETAGNWRELSNRYTANVPMAAALSRKDDGMLIKSAYFVRKDGSLIGIGKLRDNQLEQIVSLVPGMGQTIVRTLARLVNDDRIRLEVADNNFRALQLYTRLGFVQTEVLSDWYRVFPQV